MRAPFIPLVLALPLFAGCQLLGDATPPASTDTGVRLQGTLARQDGGWVFTPCQERRRFLVREGGETALDQDAEPLARAEASLYADLRGVLAASKQDGLDGELQLSRVYRVQKPAGGCDDPNFPRLLLHAGGSEPDWSVNVGKQGLMLERPGQPAQALPYMEEQLPEGRFNLSSEANGEHVELWVAPNRCVDRRDGSVNYLETELRVNGERLRGCGYFGGARDQ